MRNRPGIFRTWRRASCWGRWILAGALTWAVVLGVALCAWTATAEAQEADTITAVYDPYRTVRDSAALHDGLSGELYDEWCRDAPASPACQETRRMAAAFRAGVEAVRKYIRGNSLRLDSIARARGWHTISCDGVFPEKAGDASVGCLVLRAYLHGRHEGAEHGPPGKP